MAEEQKNVPNKQVEEQQNVPKKQVEQQQKPTTNTSIQNQQQKQQSSSQQNNNNASKQQQQQQVEEQQNVPNKQVEQQQKPTTNTSIQNQQQKQQQSSQQNNNNDSKQQQQQQQQQPQQNNNTSVQKQQQQQQPSHKQQASQDLSQSQLQQSQQFPKQKQAEMPPVVVNQKCTVQGHTDENIMGICLKDNCEKKSRLVCFTCAISNHSDHSQTIVRLSDMNQPDNTCFTRNWPTEQLAVDVNKYLKQNDPISAQQYVEEIIELYRQRLNNSLDKIKEAIKKDVKTKLSTNEKLLKDLKEKLDDTFSLQSLKQNIVELNEQKIKEEDFNKKIKLWLTGKTKKVFLAELEELYWLKKKKVIKDVFKDDLLIHFFDKILNSTEKIPKEIWSDVYALKSDLMVPQK